MGDKSRDRKQNRKDKKKIRTKIRINIAVNFFDEIKHIGTPFFFYDYTKIRRTKIGTSDLKKEPLRRIIYMYKFLHI